MRRPTIAGDSDRRRAAAAKLDEPATATSVNQLAVQAHSTPSCGSVPRIRAILSRRTKRRLSTATDNPSMSGHRRQEQHHLRTGSPTCQVRGPGMAYRTVAEQTWLAGRPSPRYSVGQCCRVPSTAHCHGTEYATRLPLPTTGKPRTGRSRRHDDNNRAQDIPGDGVRQRAVGPRRDERGHHRSRGDLLRCGSRRGAHPRYPRHTSAWQEPAAHRGAEQGDGVVADGSILDRRRVPRGLDHRTSRCGTCSGRCAGSRCTRCSAVSVGERIRIYNTCAGTGYVRGGDITPVTNWATERG